ncbi:MAG: FHA domain-containing protein [Deltaproteobacteria bacterium]|nr:FHA domain-containing protein [Deltaproteobacteria bacterium]
MFKLVIQDDEGKTTVVPLIRDEITIGRKEGNTIRLTERNVSRRHARILRNNGEVQIEDLGSYNGIRVNNARIAERVSLRVSDQVQIGDYKLYLKAEGVEQIDDARTMPIERVDTAQTDAMPAVAAPAPTTQIPVQTSVAASVAASLPAASTLVGSPNRTQVAVADTDPQGRPIASAATVAALTSTTGYGKLVVLSSNFAGKEFELSRPQMIIGRTDENDIVVNHRSISRNHAKLVREPDTGRYTISDLQSSNGVRVNGQDYGKVELRRTDVVDLGHVRLRFVEPGEDFIFSRDGVVTDVPDAGSKRTLLVAIVLGVVVLGGVVAFIAFRGKDKPTAGPIGDNNIVVTADAGDQVAVEAPDAGEIAAVTPPDASAPGPADDKVGLLTMECKEAVSKQQWAGLIDCTDRLQKLDPTTAAELRQMANRESRAEVDSRNLDEALRDKNLRKAATSLAQIPEGSVYRRDAAKKYKAAEQDAVDELVSRAKRQITPNCKDFNKLMEQETDSKGKAVVDLARREVACKVAVAVKDPIKDPVRDPVRDPIVVPEKCNADELAAKGAEAHSDNQFGPAFQFFEASYKCQPSNETLLKVVLTACRGGNGPKAKVYWKKMTTEQKNRVQAACIGTTITLQYLNGP